MRVLAVQLWKEWRDHRAAFVGLWILLAIAAAGLALLGAGREMIHGGRIVEILAFGALLYGLVVIVPELVPGEGARGTLSLLQRIPGGLAKVFWSKALFAVLAVAAAAASGYVIASAVRAVAIPWRLHSPMVMSSGAAAQLAEFLLAAVFWILAISCWVPRGLLAVPAVGVLGGGWWLWVRVHPDILKLHSPDWHLHLFLAAGFLSAWVSFVHGRSFGRGFLAAAARGGTVALLVLAPIPVSLWRWHEEWSAPIPPGGTSIVGAYLGGDARHLFLNLCRGSHWPHHAMVFDLSGRSLSRVGEPGGHFLPLWALERGGGESGAQTLLYYSQDGMDFTAIDGATGARLGTTRLDARYAGLGERGREAARAVTPWRRPDGRRVWCYDRRIETEAEDGGIETVPVRFGTSTLVGDGFWLMLSAGKWQVFDLCRHRLYEDVAFGTWILGDRWLVRHPERSAGRWNWKNPETGVEEPVAWLEDDEKIVTLLDDGRFLVQGRSLFAIDVRIPERRVIAVPEGRLREDKIRPYITEVGFHSPIRTPAGGRILRIETPRDGLWFTSLALGATELTPPFQARSVIGCLDDDTLLALDRDQSAILQVHLPTGRAETIFSTR